MTTLGRKIRKFTRFFRTAQPGSSQWTSSVAATVDGRASRSGALLALLVFCAFLLVPGFARAADDTAADNSGKNVRDQSGETLTPMDQAKGSDADVKVTQEVRKAIVADDDLSTSAHNVKIITLAGVTTLRGPVKSAQEKTRVAELAAKAAGGSTKIKNELEVAP